jgi:hypothetical protein
MGLMFDWTQGWARKPAYWVYANFYGNFPGKELVSVDADVGLDALAARREPEGGAELALWISNWSGTSYPSHGFSIENYPDSEAQVLVFDNLSSRSPVDRIIASGSPLTFSYSIPSYSSFTFKIMPRPAGAPSLAPQGIACLLLVLLGSTLHLLRRRDTGRVQRESAATRRVCRP